MTFSNTNKNKNLSTEEWKELDALRKAINDQPATVTPKKMEEFTAYLVRSLKERGG